MVWWWLAIGCERPRPVRDRDEPSPARHTGLAAHSAAPTGDTGPAPDLAALAETAFVWGYPLLVSTRTLAGAGATNRVTLQPGLSDEWSRRIVLTGRDTLNGFALLDLRSEPVVLRIPPPPDGRYFSWQLVDPWTEAFAYVGTRATGGAGGTFLVTPPGWVGDVPEGATELRSTTPQVMVVVRYVAADEAEARLLSALLGPQISVTPLSVTRGHGTPPPPPQGPPPAGLPPDVGLDPLAFWDELGDALAVNPPGTEVEDDLLASFAPLGVGPGRHPSVEAGPAVVATLVDAATRMLPMVRDLAEERTNGWVFDLDVGRYGTDWLTRARVAYVGWGAHVPEEAVYTVTDLDGEGAPLDGSARDYVLTFPTAPPADAFWSVTVYDPEGYLVGNEAGVYAVGSQTPGLVTAADGSVSIALADTAPVDPANWLPIPSGPFKLVIRLYLPRPEVLAGGWAPPPIVPVAP